MAFNSASKVVAIVVIGCLGVDMMIYEIEELFHYRAFSFLIHASLKSFFLNFSSSSPHLVLTQTGRVVISAADYLQDQDYMSEILDDLI